MPSATQGSVASLWRYPVKSMLGEECSAIEVTERGLLGDRAYALVDSADGKAATAKNPREHPGTPDELRIKKFVATRAFEDVCYRLYACEERNNGPPESLRRAFPSNSRAHATPTSPPSTPTP
jgi:MOSC N-terminal beta barrel domain